MLGLFWILLIFAMLLIDWFAAEEFTKFAAAKGYAEKKYFWWCLLVPFIGYAMVIAMPNLNSGTQAVSFDELPGL